MQVGLGDDSLYCHVRQEVCEAGTGEIMQNQKTQCTGRVTE